MRVALAGALAAAALLPAGPAEAAEGVARCGGEPATIVGTDEADVLWGTPDRDVIHGRGGRDTIRGLEGNDVICGGAGRDRIFAGPGDDVVFGGSTGDLARGGRGYDVLYGGNGDDELRGGGDGDVLRGRAGDDVARGGTGNDACFQATAWSCDERPAHRRHKLQAGETLLAGQRLVSTNGRTTLRLTADGNVTLWWGGIDQWDTDTAQYRDARLTMSAMGELIVMWRGDVVWSSGTDSSGAFAKLANNGNLVIKSAEFVPLWDRRAHPGVIDWHLPFPLGESWEAGAPHGENLSALDFGPRDGTGEVVAVASGLVGWFECQSGGRYLKVEHGDGYMSTYYHLVDIRTELIGQWVEAGTVVGTAGNGVPCGGRSTFEHVHLTLWRDGQRMSADGLMLRGYSVHAGSEPYHGHWKDTATGETILVNPGGAACCLANRG